MLDYFEIDEIKVFVNITISMFNFATLRELPAFCVCTLLRVVFLRT